VRAHRSIAFFDVWVVFSLDGSRASPIGEYAVESGQPRHCTLIGRFLYVGSQDGAEVLIFAVDREHGTLREMSRQPVAKPVCVAAAA
jgi:6-phosphogluconolactonase (cycloisomerase 2 family)